MSKSTNGNTKIVYSGGGISFCGALFLIFLVLKLLKIIDWSWWWVTAPIWIPIGLVVACFLTYLLVVVIVALCTRIKHKNRHKKIKSYYKTMFDDEEN